MPFRWLQDYTICLRLFEVMLLCLLVYQNTTLFVTLEHKTSHESLGYTLYGSKLSYINLIKLSYIIHFLL